MEITGKNADGKDVKADFIRFANDNAGKGEEFYGFGQAKHIARYRKEDGSLREADMRELATAGGIKDVKIDFDYHDESIKKWIKKEPLDQSVVYTLGRMKDDEAKKTYLSDEKGKQNFFNDGDDYYEIKDGYISPINNIPGMMPDLSDLTRLAAGAGATIGAGVGVALTGIGAAATAGAALPLTAAAGAGGAVIGESIQRKTDEWLAPEAARANKELSGTEEAWEAIKIAGGGAVEALGGQVMSRVVGKAKTVLADSASSVLSKMAGKDVLTNYAARANTSYLQSQLPTRAMSAVGDESQAVAQSLLKSTQSKDMPVDVIKGINNEAKELIKGRLKPTAEQVAELQQNKSLINVLAQEQMRKAAAEETLAQSAIIANSSRRDLVTKVKMAHIDNATDFFNGSKINTEEIFKNGGDAIAHRKAVKEGEDLILSKAKNFGLKVVREGDEISGIDQGSLTTATTAAFEDKKIGLSDLADRSAIDAFTFDKFPSVKAKSMVVDHLKDMLVKVDTDRSMKSDTKEQVINSMTYLKNMIEDHTPTFGHADASSGFRKFATEARNMSSNSDISPSARDYIRKASDAMFTYAGQASKNQGKINQARMAHTDSIRINEYMSENQYTTEKGRAAAFDMYDSACKKLGYDNSKVSEMAFSWNMINVLNNTTDKVALKYMNSRDRQAAYALLGIRNTEAMGIKKSVAKEGSWIEEAKKAAPLTTLIAKTTARAIKTPIAVAKKGISLAKKIPGVEPVSNRTAKYYGIGAAEEGFVNALQKRYSSSDNEK
jgi:hypothetical protein